MSITRSAPVQISASQNSFVPAPKAIGATTSWSKISIGASHTLALKSDGSLWGWGNNTYGQLMSGVTVTASSPVALGTKSWSAISAGTNFSVALDNNNLLWAWGDNTNGQLGTSPYAVGNVWASVALCAYYTLGIRKDNTLWAWGFNSSGQLGDGTTINKSSPVQVLLDKIASKVFGTVAHSAIIDSSSRLWMWGVNTYGQLGQNDTLTRSSPVQVPGSWITMALTDNVTYGIRTDYTLWAWGSNYSGAGTGQAGTLGDGTTISRSSPVQIGSVGTSYIAVAGNFYNGYAIDSLGKMYGWGNNQSGSTGDNGTSARSAPIQIGSPTSWTQIAAYTSGAVALDSNSKLWTWGKQGAGQLGQGDATVNRSSPVQISAFSTSSFVAVAAQADAGSALRLDGTVYVWGLNASGQLGDSTTVNKSTPTALAGISISGGTLLSNSSASSAPYGYLYTNKLYYFSINSIATSKLQYTGEIDQYSSSTSLSSPVQIGTTFLLSPTQIGTSSWSAISAGGGHVLAIRSDSTLWNWGLGTSGQTSSNTIPNYFSKSSPVQVAGSWSSISAGGSHSTAINTDGQLYAWGDNTVTQLGVPKAATNYSWIQVAGNDIATLAIRSDYTLWGWGYNNNAALGDGTTISKSSPVQIGTDSWIFISLNATVQGSGGASGIKSDGTLWSWGSNANGQLGDGTSINRSSPVQVLGGGSWSSVAAGQYARIAIRAGAQAGQVWTWGFNGTYGQLGDGTTISRSSPIQITAASSSFTFVTAASYTSYAIKTDGTIFAWGYGGSGNIGDGTTTSRSAPVQITSLGSRVFTKIYAYSSDHVHAIQNNGKLWGWGTNTTGELGDGTVVSRSSPVQVSGAQNWSTVAGLGGYTQSAGIDTSGKVYLWSSYNGNVITSGSHISNPTYYSWSQISVGPSHTVALREDGKVFAWGLNSVGQVGDLTILNRSSPVQIGGTGDEREYFVSVSAGTNFTVGVNIIGKIYAWGFNTYGQLGDTTTVSKSSPVLLTAASIASSSFVSISAGDNHVIALTTAGTVFTWGTNGSGQLGQNDTVFRSSPVQIPSMSNIAQVGAGGSFSVALDTSGRLYTWGVNDAGQLGYGYDPVQSITGNGNSNIIMLTASGKLYGVGTNNYGQLGNGTITQLNSFTLVATQPSKTWSSVVMSSYFTLAIATDGTLWSWGENSQGQLGINSVTSQSSPSQVGSSTNWRSISISGGTAYAINSSGGLYGWGYNADGQLGDNTVASKSNPTQIRSDLTWAEVVATENYLNVIAYGNTVVHARTTDGKMFSWGYNTNGEVGDNSTVAKSSPVQIGTSNWVSLGNKHAIRQDGTLWGWGYGNVGTVGDLTVAPRSSPVQIGSPGSTAWDKFYGGVDQYNAGLSPYCCVFAIKADGTLWGWGNGAIYGFLGDGTTTAKNSPIQLASTVDSGKFKAVFNLGTHIYALSGNDNLWAWGNAATASINLMGLGDATTKSSPVQITAHPGTGNPPYLSISTFYQYNATSSPVQVGTSSWTLVSAGYRHVAAIDINGRLFAWGDNTYGQLGTFLTNASFVQGVSSGGTVSALLRNSDSKVFLSGYNDYGQLGDNTTVAKSNPIQLMNYSPTSWRFISRAINRDSAGTTLAIDSKYNILYAWGYGGLGQLGDGTTLNRSSPVNIGALVQGGGAAWAKAVAGQSFSVGIRTDGTLWGWGYAAAGNLGYVSWKQIVVNSLNGYAIDSIGRLFAWGYGAAGAIGINDIAPRSSPVQIGSNVAWKSIAIPNLPLNSFNGYVLALKVDNSLWSWGYNLQGQLGTGVTTTASSPVLVSSAMGFASIAIATSTSMAIDLMGRLWTWGQGASGELGDSTTTARSFPTQITTDTSNWSFVVAGGNHVAAVRTDGTVWSWGLNTSGQLGDGTTVTKSSPVALTGGGSWIQISAGYSHTVGLKSNYTLYAWGSGTSGQLGQGTDATNRSSPVQIASGGTVNSVSLTGSNYIAVYGDTTTLSFGTGDFTFECWAFLNTPTPTALTQRMILDTNAGGDATGTGRFGLWVVTSTGTLTLFTGTGTIIASSAASAFLPYTWYHVAVSRVSGSTRLFLNGTQVGTTATDSTNYAITASSVRPLIGINGYDAAGNGWIGYLSNMRFVKTQGLFTGTFTPATSNLTTSTVGATGAGAAGSLTGTVTLLTLQSSTIRDNSSYANNMSPTSTVTTTPPMNNAIPSTFTQSLVYESWTSINSGGNSNFAIKRSDNSVYGWGDNSNFQLLQTPSTYSWMMLSGRLGIKTDGTLWAWGGGDFGEMGQGDTLSRSSPTQIGTDKDWMWCDDSGPQSLAVAAIKNDYRAFVWGSNINCTLGINENSTNVAGRSSPVQLPGSWIQVKLGPVNGVGLRSNGTVWTWGDANPVLGSNLIPAGQRSSPVQIASADSFTQVAIGGDAIFAIKTNGTLWAWGYGTNGTIGDGTTANRSSPVQIGASTWSVVAGLAYATGAIDSIGRLFTWGSGSSGGLGSGTTANRSSPVLISVTGSSFTMVAGKDAYRFTTDPSCVARTTAGTYYVWGVNAQGQLGDNTTVNKSTPVIAFALANSTTGAQIAVADGIRVAPGGIAPSLYVTGRNNYGSVGDNTTVNRSSPVQISTEMRGILSPTMIFSAPYQASTILGAPNTSSFTAIGVGPSWGAAIASNANIPGTLWTWGIGTWGQLGDMTTVNRSSPVQIGANYIGLSPFSAGNTSSPVQIASGSWNQVAVGISTIYAIKSDYTLWSWGANNLGQVGDGGVYWMSSPVQINSGELTDPNAYSMYFMGGWEQYTITSGFAFGTGDFTIEFWAFPVISPDTNYNPFFTTGNSGGGQEIRISQNLNGNGFGFLVPNNSNNADVYAAFGHLPLFNWYHLALVRSGSTIALYKNGVCVGTATGVSFNHTAVNALRIANCQPAYSDGTFKGYMSNVRVIKGQAIYTGFQVGTTYFTPATAPLTTSTVGATGSGVAGSLTGTVQLLALRSNVFAGTFTDDSASAWPLVYYGGKLSAFTPFTSLRTNYSYVNVTTGYDQSVAITTTGKLFSWGGSGYGTIGDNTNAINRSDPVQLAIGTATGTLSYSVYFGRFINNWLYAPTDTNSTLGTSDHTIEFWCKIYSNGAGVVWQYNYGSSANATNKYYMTIGSTTSALYLGNGTGYGITITATNNNVWYLVSSYWAHNAIVRSGNTFTWYVNGVSVGSGTYAANIPAQTTYGWQFGSDSTSNIYGAISNFRVVVGQALYTGNFKPATSPLTTSTVGATGSGAAASLTGTVPVLLFNTSNPLYNAGIGPQLLKSGTYYEPIADFVNTPFSQQTFPAVLPNYAYSSITQIASGSYHHVVLTSNNILYSWGRNDYGQVGDRSQGSRSFPIQLPGTVSSPTNYSVRIFGPSDYIILPSALASTTGMGVGLAGNKVTMEMFIYPFYMDGASYTLFNCWWGGSSGGRWQWGYGPGSSYGNCTNLYFIWTTAASSSTVTTTSYLVKYLQWNHVAITIDATTATSTNINFYCNGALAGAFTGQDLSAQTSHAALVSGGAWYLFTQPSGYSPFYGYASNARIVRDVLVYTGAYTVPTSNLTNTQSASTNISAITAGQTALLTLQSATIVDNSYNNYTLTTNTAAVPNELNVGVTDVVPFSTGAITYDSFSQIYASASSSQAVKATDATVWAWGRNDTGEFGINNTLNYYSPVQTAAYQYIYQTKVSSPVQVQAGSSFTFVNTRGWSTAAVPINAGVTVWMWGRNIEGQLNTNDTVSRSSPVQMAQNPVGQSVSFTVLGTGVSNIVGLGVYGGSNGLMFNAGGASVGQMADNTIVSKSIAIQINTGTMNPLLYPKPTTGSNWGSYTQIQVNQYTATVIDNNNKLYVWGNNAYGGLARPGTSDGYYISPILMGSQTPSGSASPVQIVGSWGAVSAGTRHTLALNSSNNMYTWGADPAVKGVSWKSLSSQNPALYGVRSDGTLWASGYNGDAGLGDGTTISRSNPVQIPGSWVYVAAIQAAAAGIRADGTLWTWGLNSAGQLGDGTVVNKSSPVQVAGGGSWATVAGGRSHWVGIKTDGTMWGWGNGYNGQLGMGYSLAAATKSSPTQIIANNVAGTDVATLPFPTTWSKVSCGDYSTYAVSNVGDLWVFGYNNIGQLGLNDTVDRSNPVQLMAGVGIVDITAGGPGGTTTHVIKGDGTLWGWGLNTNGQIGDGTVAYRSSPVQIGTSKWVSLSLNGDVNRYAMRSDGTLWGWGYNGYGQLMDGTTANTSSPIQLPSSWAPQSIPTSGKWLMTATWSTSGNTNWWVAPTGELYGSGQNRYGELGVGTYNQSMPYNTFGGTLIPGFSTSSPVQIGSGTWGSINAGNDFNLATNGSNALFAWGLNTSYQVGSNSGMNVVSSPVQIGTGINLIDAGTIGGYLPQ
jgi:alpha-tubulin suppressor-like RCC1 family protein